MRHTRALLLVAGVLAVAVICLAYAPDVGTGFKQDDFGWVEGSRVRQPGDWLSLVTRNTGFYRPAVAITFALDELAFGMRPFGYGLTNLALLVACLFAIAAVARALGLERGAALAAGACWSLNTQGINMAVVWTSGRTALVLVLFAALAARALVRGRVAQTAIFTFLALLSKEEAVMLPVLLFVWAGFHGNSEVRSQNSEGRERNSEGGEEKAQAGEEKAEGRRKEAQGSGGRFDLRVALRATWPLVFVLAAYAVLRHASGAFGPFSAPPYYRLTFSPARIAENVVKYLDFAATFPAAVVTLAAIIAGSVPRPSRLQARIALLGIGWLAAGYAVTVFVPIRSPLYACYPAVGTSIAAAALLDALWSRAAGKARWRLVSAGLVLPVLLLPVYWARNVRHARGARLSAQVLHDLEQARDHIPPDAVVVLLDDPTLPPTERLPAAFGTLYDIAVRETLGRPTRSWVEPPPDGWQLSGLRPPDPAARTVVFALKNGHLVRVDGSR